MRPRGPGGAASRCSPVARNRGSIQRSPRRRSGFSPALASRSFAIDTKRLAKITHEAGALLWIDIGQNVGLVAAGLMPSPVADADVVTFPTNDSLQGPEGAIILCKKELAETIERAVIDNGQLWLRGFVASVDGKEMVSAELRGNPADDEALGRQLAETLRAQGADAILAKLACHA